MLFASGVTRPARGEVELRFSVSSVRRAARAEERDPRRGVFVVDASATLSAAKRRASANASALWFVRSRRTSAATVAQQRNWRWSAWPKHLREALKVRRPRTKTKPTRESKERRLDDKRRRGEAKRLRQPPANSGAVSMRHNRAQTRVARDRVTDSCRKRAESAYGRTRVSDRERARPRGRNRRGMLPPRGRVEARTGQLASSPGRRTWRSPRYAALAAANGTSRPSDPTRTTWSPSERSSILDPLVLGVPARHMRETVDVEVRIELAGQHAQHVQVELGRTRRESL